jgi:hypothetical protein
VNHTQRNRVVDSQGVQIVSNTSEDFPTGAQGYAEDGYARLLDIRDKRRVVTIVTVLRTYTDMMMTSLDVPRDARSGDALLFTATFKQIRFAELRRKEVTVAKEPKAKDKVALGKQVAKETPKPQREKSFATYALDGLGIKLPTPKSTGLAP